MPEKKNDIPPQEREPRRRKRALRIAFTVVLILLTTQLVFIVFIFLALQTRWGAEQMRRIVVNQANLALLAEVEVGQLGGNFFTSINGYDLRLIQDGHVTARMDTIKVNLRALPLLWRTLHLTNVYISRPQFYGVQGADTVWNFQKLVEPAEPDTVPTPWTLRIRKFEIRDGLASMNFYTPAGDSIVLVDDIHLEASDFRLSATEMFATVDTMRARAESPETITPIDIRFSASYQEDAFSVGGFRLISDSSDVRARGFIPLDERLETDSLYFFVEAHPFATRDIRAFFPALEYYGTVHATLRIEGYDGLATAFLVGEAADGSSADLQATASLRSEGPQIYRTSGSIRRINPAYFTRDPSLAGIITADLATDLTGDELDEISGTSRLRLFDSIWQGIAIRDSHLQADFDRGAGQFNLETGIGASSISVRGSGRFFDERPTYAASGVFEQFDLAALTGDPADRTNLNFRFGISGDGIDPDDLVASGTVDAQPSVISDIRIDGGRLEASMFARRLNLDARARMLDGEIAVIGSVDPLDEVIGYRVTSGSFSNVNVAALTGDPETTSALTGTFTLSGRGTDPDQLALEADLRLFNSRYDNLQIESAALSSSIRNRLLQFDTQAALDAGALEAGGQIRPFDDPIVYDVPRGRFANLDLGILAGDPDLSSDLTGSFSAQGVGTDPETMSLDAVLRLDRSTYRNETIEVFAFNTEMRQGALALSLEMESTAGNVRLTGDVGPFAEAQPYSITRGDFNNLNLGPWLADPGLQTDLTGSLLLEGRGFDPQAAEAAGRLQLEPSVVNQEEISTGIITLNMNRGDMHTYVGLQTETGHVDVNASGRFLDEIPSYYVSGNLMNVNVDRLAGMPELRTRLTVWFNVEGTGFEPETMDATGWVLGYDSRLLGGRLDTLNTVFAVRDARVLVDTLHMAGEMFALDAGGVLTLDHEIVEDETEFVFRMDVINPTPAAPLLDAEYIFAEGEISGRVSGRPERIRFEAEADLIHVAYEDIRLGTMVTSVAGEYTHHIQFTSFTQVENLSLPTLLIERTDVQIFYTPEAFEVDGDFRIDHTRSASVKTRLVTLEDRQLLEIESLTLNLREDVYELQQPAEVSIVGEQYYIRNFLLAADGQQIAADGVIDFAGEQSAVITVESVRLDPFTDLLQREGLRGVVDATILMSGPAEAPFLTGTLVIDDLEVRDRDAGDVNIQLDYEDFQLVLNMVAEYEGDQRLTAEGTIPMDLSLVGPGRPPAEREVDLEILAERYPIRIVEPFLDPETVERIDGLLTATIHIGGRLDSPVLDGDVTLRDGVLVLPDIGVTYREMEIDAVLEGNQALIDRAQFRSGRGGLEATGTLDLEELALDQMGFNLDLRMTRFEAANTQAYRVVTRGNLQLRGTYAHPELYGNLVLEDANFHLGEELTGTHVEDVQLTERDIQVVEARFGIRVGVGDTVRFDFYEALRMDISLEIERNVWLRSRQAPRMNIEFTGLLDLSKEPFGELMAFGEIETTERSRVDQFGRRFDITTGELVFNGPVTDPIMNIVAEYRVRSRTRIEHEAVITLTLEGPLDELRPEISSDPPMEMTDILSYIATGRPAGEGFFGGGQTETGGFLGTSADFARGFVTGQMYTLFEGFAAAELGLDVINIEQDPFTNETILTAGKYISNDVFASVSRPLTRVRRDDEPSLTQFLIEYEAYRWLMVRLSRRQAGPGVNLLWEYAY